MHSHRVSRPYATCTIWQWLEARVVLPASAAFRFHPARADAGCRVSTFASAAPELALDGRLRLPAAGVSAAAGFPQGFYSATWVSHRKVRFQTFTTSDAKEEWSEFCDFTSLASTFPAIRAPLRGIIDASARSNCRRFDHVFKRLTSSS